MDKKLDKKLDLSRLAKRLVSEDGMADSGAACSAIQEYKRFLCLVSEWDTVGHACYIPAPAVDKVWQRHVLDTQQYFDDCEAFDVPGYYLHRHELWSIKSWPQHSKVIPAGSEIGSLSADAAVVQGHYDATKAAYLRAFGEAPRQDVWPDQYEYTAPVGGHRQLNNSSGDMYVAYALPQALLPRDTHTLYSAVSIEEYAMPTEQELMDDLKWVGDLVFDSLPTKKNVCAEGEALTRISFDSDVGRDTAVGRVVREYARFLLLIMKKKKIFHLKNRKIWNGDLEDEEEFSHYEFESDAELTPSKLVDECWHAHILRSPAYFEFCTKHAPFGEYIHHFPHFDKPHGYHVPGFKATLELYKQEFGGEIPVKSVWGVLGESGGGCGGGGCGGGGDGGDGGGGCGGGDGGGACSAALCMFSNHNRTRNSHAAKVRPLIDNSLVGFGGNCGAGIFTSSCGAGLGNAVDPSDLRRPQDRPKVNIIPNYRKVRPGTDTAIQKILCEINVFETCLNKHNLSSSVPAPTSCIKLAAYSTTYMKEGFLCSGPTPVPIKFMSPAYVSSALFSQFQAAMSDAITNRYQAAVLISRLSGSNLKDGYWRTWKISVFGAITSVLDAINQALSQINLMAVIVFVENRGGEVYITPKLAGIWSAPPGGALAFHTPMIAGAPKRGRELAWSNESLMSPENITRLNREILPTSQDGIVEGSWELLHSGKDVLQGNSKTTMVVSFLPVLYMTKNRFSYPIQACGDGLCNVSALIFHQPYNATYNEQKFLRSDETKQIPFANDKNMGQQLFQYIQRKLECYAVEVYAQISVCFPMIKDYPLWFNIELCAKIDTACSTTLNSLLNSINNEFLSRQNLLLKSFWIDSSSTCQIVIQASGSKWAECIGVPIRKDIMTVPDVQEVYKSARLHWLEIGRLIGEVSIPSTSRSLRASPLEASPPVTSRSRRSSKTASSTANSIVVNPGFITISITVPVGLPASGAVLRIAHPSNHRVLQDIFIPAGALPGSQLLVQIPA